MSLKVWHTPINLVLVVLVTLLCSAGCGDREAEQKMDFANSTVKSALEFWQQGGKPEELMTGENPVEFHDDDWDVGAKLIEFEIRQTYMDRDGTARCAVTLKVQRGKKAPVDVRCAYQILTVPKVMVGRDPMA